MIIKQQLHVSLCYITQSDHRCFDHFMSHKITMRLTNDPSRLSYWTWFSNNEFMQLYLKSFLLFRLVHGAHLQDEVREPSWSDDTFLDSHLFYLIIWSRYSQLPSAVIMRCLHIQRAALKEPEWCLISRQKSHWLSVHDFFWGSLWQPILLLQMALLLHYLLLCVTRFIIYCFMRLVPRDTSALFTKASMCWTSFNLRLHPPSSWASRFVTMNRPGIYVSKQKLIYI